MSKTGMHNNNASPHERTKLVLALMWKPPLIASLRQCNRDERLCDVCSERFSLPWWFVGKTEQISIPILLLGRIMWKMILIFRTETTVAEAGRSGAIDQALGGARQRSWSAGLCCRVAAKTTKRRRPRRGRAGRLRGTLNQR